MKHVAAARQVYLTTPAMAAGNVPHIQYPDYPINSGKPIAVGNENGFFALRAFCETSE
jgi:hypothetical protein